MRQLLPALGDDDLLVGLAVAVDVDDERDLPFGGDEHAVARRMVPRRRQCHADRGDEAPLFSQNRSTFSSTPSPSWSDSKSMSPS